MKTKTKVGGGQQTSSLATSLKPHGKPQSLGPGSGNYRPIVSQVKIQRFGRNLGSVTKRGYRAVSKKITRSSIIHTLVGSLH